MARALHGLLSVLLVAGAAIGVAPTAQAAPAAHPWDCLTRADVVGDAVDYASTVDCAQPHQAQVLAVRKLPASIARLPYAELGKVGSPAYTRWTTAGHRLCAGAPIANAIWGAKGPALMKALGSRAVAIIPDFSQGRASIGWVLPDAASWQAGDRSLYCMLHIGKESWRGDIRDIATNRSVPDLRTCLNAAGSATPCSQPHDAETLFTWYTKGFPDKGPAALSDAEWVSWDRSCQAAAETLIGASRTDMGGRANTRADRNQAWGPHKKVMVMVCEVRRVEEANLPAGTVVGLGNAPLR